MVFNKLLVSSFEPISFNLFVTESVFSCVIKINSLIELFIDWLLSIILKEEDIPMV